MTITVGKLLHVGPVLANLGAQKLPALAAFKVARILQKIEPEMKLANERRLDAFKSHGEQRDDQIIVLPEKREALEAELKPLMEAEITIAGIDPLPLGLLEKAELSAGEFLLLEETKLVVA